MAPPAHQNTRFEVVQVNGRFNDRTGTNDIEAQETLRLLQNIKPTSRRTYPRIGILAFTPGQRDLIASYLLNRKQKSDETGEKILQLERNGLGVFHLEEVQGEQFDITLLCMTFGLTDMRSSITRKIQQLNQPEYLAYWNGINCLPSREVYIIHSYPEVYLDQWRNEPEHRGLFMLAQYIQYAEAPVGSRSAIIHHILEHQAPATLPYAHQFFLQEVAAALQPYLEPGRIRYTDQPSQLRNVLIVYPKPNMGKAIILVPDGVLSAGLTTNISWEKQQRDRLQQLGYHLQTVSSVQWWKNPKQEARRLASQIIKYDEAALAGAEAPASGEDAEA